ELLDTNTPGLYNQAIMDFGNAVCKPQSPLCFSCPMRKFCVAYKTDSIAQYPVKAKKLKIQTRYFQYFLLHYRGELLVHQRTEKDIWLQLYDFPLHESSSEQSEKEAFKFLKAEWNLSEKDMKTWEKSKPFVQQLSHQKIIAQFYSIVLTKKPSVKNGYQKIAYEDL